MGWQAVESAAAGTAALGALAAGTAIGASRAPAAGTPRTSAGRGDDRGIAGPLLAGANPNQRG